MSAPQSIHDIIEDHALERVPDGERHGWLAMSWNTVGIVTTLVQVYVGALITFIAGMKIALLSGVITITSLFILSHYILNTIIPVEFITAIIVSLLLYPLLYRVFYQGRQS